MTQSPREDYLGSEDKDEAVSQPASENGAGTDEAHGEADLGETVELNITDPHFMADAYDTYADLRARGPVSRVRFSRGEEESDDAEEQVNQFFRSETFFVTHYDEVVETLLD
ncbi:MAG: cytochrome P450 [Actinobacteria bacterium]|nr:cytochrome P450 [Actinomycetota bacterium]